MPNLARKPLTFSLAVERETKNSIRFTDAPVVIGPIYVPRTVLAAMGWTSGDPLVLTLAHPNRP